MTEMGPLRFHIRGLLSDTTYHMARCCAEVTATYFITNRPPYYFNTNFVDRFHFTSLARLL